MTVDSMREFLPDRTGKLVRSKICPKEGKPHIVLRKDTYRRVRAFVYLRDWKNKVRSFAWTWPMGPVEKWEIMKNACVDAKECHRINGGVWR